MCFIYCLIFFVFLSSNAKGIEITVNVSGDSNFTSIQSAIDNANDGDTIIVYSGVYTEKVYVDKELTIISKSNETIIQTPDSESYVFHISTNNLTIDGFRISGNKWKDVGIYVENCSNNTIVNNTIYNINCSIFLFNSVNNNIKNNYLLQNNYGIYLLNSNNSTLSNNTLKQNSRGNYLFKSKNNTLINNFLFDNTVGIELEYSTNNKLINNTQFDGVEGILLNNSYNNSLINNTVSNNLHGINLLNSWNNIILNSTALISNLGICLKNSCNNTLANNNASYNLMGFRLDYSNDNTLNNNYATNDGDGFYLLKSNNNTLNNNYAIESSNKSVTIINKDENSNKRCGINLYASNNNNLRDNILNSNGWYGIYLKSSNYNLITNNTANSNGMDGIHLLGSNKNMLNKNIANLNKKDGIYFIDSNKNNLTNNIAYSRNWNEVSFAEYIQFKENTFNDNLLNKRFGIFIELSSKNILINNSKNYYDNHGIFFNETFHNNISSLFKNKILNYNTIFILILIILISKLQMNLPKPIKYIKFTFGIIISISFILGFILINPNKMLILFLPIVGGFIAGLISNNDSIFIENDGEIQKVSAGEITGLIFGIVICFFGIVFFNWVPFAKGLFYFFGNNIYISIIVLLILSYYYWHIIIAGCILSIFLYYSPSINMFSLIGFNLFIGLLLTNTRIMGTTCTILGSIGNDMSKRLNEWSYLFLQKIYDKINKFGVFIINKIHKKIHKYQSKMKQKK